MGRLVHAFRHTWSPDGDSDTVPIPDFAMPSASYFVQAMIADVASGGGAGILTAPVASRTTTQLLLRSTASIKSGTTVDVTLTLPNAHLVDVENAVVVALGTAPAFVIKAGSTSRPLLLQILGTDGEPEDLSEIDDSTLVARFEFADESRTEFPLVIESAVDGLVSYQWELGDTDKVGIHQVDVRAEDDDGEVYIWPPQGGHFRVQFTSPIAAP